MRCHFLAEYPGAVRTVAGEPLDCDDADEARAECKRRLAARPTSFRVEAWQHGAFNRRDYVTRATRGTPINDHPINCFETCCLATPREPESDDTINNEEDRDHG